MAPHRVRVILERHPDGFVAYPVGLRGVIVGEGDTAEAALSDVESAIRFHLETFGPEAWDEHDQVLDVQVRDIRV
jgi:predicted RNase H-like HicB family nuclease